MNTLPQRLETFLQGHRLNPMNVTREEMQEVLRALRGLRERPVLTDVAIGQRVGLSLAWALGPSRAGTVIREAAKAGAITREESEAIRVGIMAATLFPPPPGKIPPPLKELERFAERRLGFVRPRVG